MAHPTEEQLKSWEGRLNCIPFLLKHPRRTEFISYIRNGIPSGMMNSLFFEDKAPFTLFVVTMTGVKDDAHALMRHIVSLNVDDELRRLNRLGRVDYLFSTCFFKWQDCDGTFIPVEKLKAFNWLEDFVEKIRPCFMKHFNHRRLVNNLIQVMQYCLLLLYRHPDGATIAVADVERKLRLSKKTVIGHLRTLREEFPILTVLRPANHMAGLATDYVLNEAYVESVLGYSIRQGVSLAA